MNRVIKQHYDGLNKDTIDIVRGLGVYVEIISVLTTMYDVDYMSVDLYGTEEQFNRVNKELWGN